MVGKVKAAVDARQSTQTLIVGRTDAAAVEGFPAALDRASAYLEAGADILFVEAPRTQSDMRATVERFGSRVPLVANMVEGGHTPILSCEQLGAIGFKLVIAPGAMVRVLIPAAEALLASLKRTGTSQDVRERMVTLAGVNERVGLASAIEDARRYDPLVQGVE